MDELSGGSLFQTTIIEARTNMESKARVTPPYFGVLKILTFSGLNGFMFDVEHLSSANNHIITCWVK